MLDIWCGIRRFDDRGETGESSPVAGGGSASLMMPTSVVSSVAPVARYRN